MELITAKFFTPILNTPNFFSVFGEGKMQGLDLDEKGFLRSLETVCFPGTVFTGKKTKVAHILEVKTSSYPYKGPLYIDERFTVNGSFPQAVKLPSASAVLACMQTLLGMPYMWGSNCLGEKLLYELYSPKNTLEPVFDNIWHLKGFDCSGLIYFTTNGWTPRNTSSWFTFGRGLPIEGKSLSSIISMLKPLDSIVYKGHILFVYNENFSIESREGSGVVLCSLKNRLQSLFAEGKIPVNNLSAKDCFLIRRWHPDLY